MGKRQSVGYNEKEQCVSIESSKMLPCQTVENDPLHLLLEIERKFRPEERMNLASKRGQITPEPVENNQGFF